MEGWKTPHWRSSPDCCTAGDRREQGLSSGHPGHGCCLPVPLPVLGVSRETKANTGEEARQLLMALRPYVCQHWAVPWHREQSWGR